MSKGALELRSWWAVALGYVVAPLVALTALWLYLVVPGILSSESGGFKAAEALMIWGLIILFGGWACLTAEMLIVTPILIGFKRYRWRWMNGWSAVAIGFALGAFPWFAFSAWPLSGVGQSYIVGGVQLISNGERTLAGWAQLFRDAAMMGGVGLIAAVVFLVIAVRRGSLELPSTATEQSPL
jgi:hypothetical protein